MLLNQDQIADLVRTIDNSMNFFIAKNLGPDYLSTDEKSALEKVGINLESIYDENIDFFKQSFYFGLISNAMKNDAKLISYDDLKNHFLKGKHVPLTPVEKYSVDSIKRQFLGDIRASKGRIFQDVNNIIADKEKFNRVAYEKVLRDEIEQGYINQKTTGEIARDIAKKTGDWSRNFHRIVEYVSHYAFNEGRVAALERADENSEVYFDVFDGACKHCIRLYLTAGLGSKPIIFTIKELKENGTNIGRKVDDWKATLSPTHPYCRCTVNRFIKGYEWDQKLKRFEIKHEIKIVNRKPIKFTVKINDKEKEFFV